MWQLRENTDTIIIDFTNNIFNIKPQKKSIYRGTEHVELFELLLNNLFADFCTLLFLSGLVEATGEKVHTTIKWHKFFNA